MNLLDIAILIVAILITVRGFFRGIIQEAATLLGLLISFFLASYYYGDLSRFLLRFLPGHDVLLGLISFLLLFVFCLVIFHSFGILLKKAIRVTLLGWLDRALGAVFGLIKAGVIIFILVTVLTMALPKTSGLLNNSRLFPWAVSLTGYLTLLIPPKIKDDYFRKKQDFLDYWAGKEKNIKKLQRDPAREATR